MTILAHELQSMARRMTVALNEIQPAVSVAGLEIESETIRMMNDDLSGFEHALVRLMTTQGERQDVVSHAVSLQAMLAEASDPSEMSDEELRLALLAAESFIKRGYEYMISKQSYLSRNGGVNATA